MQNNDLEFKSYFADTQVTYSRMPPDFPKSRSVALTRGGRHYFTGRPCSKGHITFRHVTGTCVKCQQIANRKWAARNPGEGARRSLEWQKKNREKARIKSLKFKRKAMGMPEPTRPCPAHCENCNRKLEPGVKTHLDHDHATGKFRGWLCNKCNLGLGALGDSIAAIRRTLEYLERAELKQTPEPIPELNQETVKPVGAAGTTTYLNESRLDSAEVPSASVTLVSAK